MTESQDHRPPWRVSDERVRIMCEEEEKLHSPWLTDSPLIRDEVELALDLRDARERIRELEDVLGFYADRATWKRIPIGGSCEFHYMPPSALIDSGRCARVALGMPAEDYETCKPRPGTVRALDGKGE